MKLPKKRPLYSVKWLDTSDNSCPEGRIEQMFYLSRKNARKSVKHLLFQAEWIIFEVFIVYK